tara:strand:+ start:490 stop:654 length:165 start_codon:yes stop_codon:yes gene_type:complete
MKPSETYLSKAHVNKDKLAAIANPIDSLIFILNKVPISNRTNQALKMLGIVSSR